MTKANQTPHDTRAHAKFSASGSSRWLNCPGSIVLSESAPTPPTSPYALEGTQAHECLEFLILNRFNLAKAKKMAAKKYDADMIKHGLEGVAYVVERMKEVGDCKLEVESRVDASSFTTKGQFGTSDISIVQEFGKLIVIDYKYGAGIPVDPDENSQLIYYALGKSAEYHHNFTEVELVVMQPRANHHSGETTRSWSAPLSYLLDVWVPKFKNGVKECLKPNAKDNLKAGDWCQFCPVAPVCPELSKKALERAQIVFDDVEEEGSELVETPIVRELPISNLPNILDACDKLETWIKEVRKHAYSVMNKGHVVKGFKLVEKRATQKWVGSRPSVLARHHFGADAFDYKLKSPTQFKKEFKGNKKAEVFVKKYTEKKSSGLTLVREDDNRTPVNYIDAVFSVIED